MYEKLTVTSAVVALDNVAVNVSEEPAFSAILDADELKVTVGALSFSVIVIVVVCVPFSVAPPPETVEIAIIPVSFGSNVGRMPKWIQITFKVRPYG